MRGVLIGTVGLVGLCLLAGCQPREKWLPLSDPGVELDGCWRPCAGASGVFATAGKARAAIRFPKPWAGDGFLPPAPMAVLLDYRDTIDAPAALYLMRYCSPQDRYVGHFGGTADGQWRRAAFAIDPELIGADGDGRCLATIGKAFRPAKDQTVFPPTSTPGLQVRAIGFAPLTEENLRLSRERRWACYDRLVSLAKRGLEPAHEPSDPPRDVPPEYERLGFVPFNQPVLHRLGPYEAPKPERWGLRPVRMRAARDQREIAAVALHTLGDLELRVSVSRLVSADGAAIGADRIDLHRVMYVPNQSWEYIPEKDRWGPVQKYWLSANRLPPVDGPFKVPAGSNGQVWLTVSVPADAPSGEYRGRLTLRATGRPKVAADVVLTVRPFVLDSLSRHNFVAGCFTAGPEKAPELDDMVEHGLNNHMIFYDAFSFDMQDADGRMATDWSRWNYFARQLKAHGLTGPLVIVLGNDNKGFYERHIGEVFNIPNLTRKNHFVDIHNEKLNRLYVEGLQQLMANARANDWPEVVLLPYDEPTEQLIEKYRHRCRLIHKHLPGVRIYGVSMNRLAWAQEVADDSDIIVANGDFDRISRLCRERGKGFWFYRGGVAAPWEGLDWVRQGFGYQPWRVGAQARWWWVYHWVTGDPLVELGRERTGWVTAAYESHGRPISCPGYEMARAGLDDLRHLLMLDRLIREDPDSPASRLARDLLGQLRRARDYSCLRDALFQWLEHQPDRPDPLGRDGFDEPLREAAALMIRRILHGLPKGAGEMNLLAVTAGEARAKAEERVEVVVEETSGAGTIRVTVKADRNVVLDGVLLKPGEKRNLVLHDPAEGAKKILKHRRHGIRCQIDKANLPGKIGDARITIRSGDRVLLTADSGKTPPPLRHDVGLNLELIRPRRKRN